VSGWYPLDVICHEVGRWILKHHKCNDRKELTNCLDTVVKMPTVPIRIAVPTRVSLHRYAIILPEFIPLVAALAKTATLGIFVLGSSGSGGLILGQMEQCISSEMLPSSVFMICLTGGERTRCL
jgi:hypothetical protein